MNLKKIVKLSKIHISLTGDPITNLTMGLHKGNITP